MKRRHELKLKFLGAMFQLSMIIFTALAVQSAKQGRYWNIFLGMTIILGFVSLGLLFPAFWYKRDRAGEINGKTSFALNLFAVSSYLLVVAAYWYTANDCVLAQSGFIFVIFQLFASRRIIAAGHQRPDDT